MSDKKDLLVTDSSEWLAPNRERTELVVRGIRDVAALAPLPTRDFVEEIRSIYLAAPFSQRGPSVGEVMANIKESLAQHQNKTAQEKQTEWLEIQHRASEGGIEAQRALGGHFWSEDLVESAKWYLKAAEQGDADAQFVVGEMYLKGEGLDQNYAVALDWFLKAAGQDHEKARWHLIDLYRDGIGIEQNLEASARWVRIDAEQSYITSSHAQAWLGHLYETGEGVAIDLVQSYLWTALGTASSLDVEQDTLTRLEGVAAHMTPPEIARAQGLARRKARKLSPRTSLP